jgi:dTMP kinase
MNPASGDISPRTEALLYAADRAQHAATVLRPALDAGTTVICDRYMDSSVVYQGHGRDLGADTIRDLSLWGTGGLLPDLTIVLDLDPRIGIARASTTEFGTADRFEQEAIAFHDTVRAGFLALAERDAGRYAVIDATVPIDVIHDQVLCAVAERTAVRVAAAAATPTLQEFDAMYASWLG